MLVVLGILSLGLLGLVIYYAFSPRSSRLLKLSALIALGAICLTLGICAIILIRGSGGDADGIPFPVFSDTVQPAKGANRFIDIIFLAALVIILSLIIFISIRHKKQLGRPDLAKSPSSPIFQDHPDLNEKQDDGPMITDDESFDIEIK